MRQKGAAHKSTDEDQETVTNIPVDDSSYLRHYIRCVMVANWETRSPIPFAHSSKQSLTPTSRELIRGCLFH